MQYFARIQDNVVVEVIELPDGFKLADCFYPSIVATIKSCPQGTVEGQTVNPDGTYNPPNE